MAHGTLEDPSLRCHGLGLKTIPGPRELRLTDYFPQDSEPVWIDTTGLTEMKCEKCKSVQPIRLNKSQVRCRRCGALHGLIRRKQ